MENTYFSSEKMYQFDQYTIEEIGIPSAVLIERAAYSAFLELEKLLTHDDTLLIVAGAGNNGADAVALARMLHLKNHKVTLFVTSKDNYSKELEQQLNIVQNINLAITYELEDKLFEQATYIIEGIFGIGISREVEGHYQTIIETINKQDNTTTIALDIPSGLSAKTGQPFETVIHADYTFTFGFLKKGMDTDEGKELCGEISVGDIGYPVQQLKTLS